AAGLHDHRIALRTARNVERAEHREILAAMIELMQRVRPEELPGFLVPNEGVVVPAVPQAEHNPGKLARAFVALAVLVVLFAIEIARLVLLTGRHEVPAGAAAAQVIERRELPRHVERLVVAR